MRIISIDPGYERVGILIIEKEPAKNHGREVLLYSDCFKTPAKTNFYDRLGQIAVEIDRIIKEYSPSAMAVERLFFSKNTKTAMQVAEARGVIIYQAVANKLKVFEYDPVEIKVAITGYGKSDKHQITSMVSKLISMEKKGINDDEYDAIAVGLTCLAIDSMNIK